MTFSDTERKELFSQELLPLFQQLIRNACVNDGRAESGQEIKSAQTLATYLDKAGLECRFWEPITGRVSLLCKLPPKEGLPTLCYMGHTDVVPARSEDWSHPPFSAHLDGSQVWGRGAVDMLCWTAAQAVALAAHHRKKSELSWNLTFLALADEESAGTWGARYLTENHWTEVNCDLMITELGGFYLENRTGHHSLLTLAEKGVCWLKLSWKGTSAHGSMPYRADNAVLKAAQAAMVLGAWSSAESHDSIYSRMKNVFLDEGKLDLDDLDRALAAFLHTAGHTTISCNVIEGGTKANLIPDRAQLIVDIRFLEPDCPDGKPESVIKLVRRVLGPQLAENCDIEVIDFFPPTQTSPEYPSLDRVRQILEAHHPQANLLTCRIGGVTDGRFWRVRGVPVLGFSLFDTDLTIQEYARRIHSANERISLRSLEKCLDFFLDFPLGV